MENPLAGGARHLPEFTGQEPPHLAWLKKLARIILTTRLRSFSELQKQAEEANQ
jgi:hypothetical protein